MDIVAFNVIVSDGKTEIFDNNYAALKIAVIENGSTSSLNGEEWNAAGFYILLSDIDEGKYHAYVGKAPAGIKKRIEQHTRGKTFWSRAILIRKDTSNGFNSAEVAWLEAKFYEIFNDVKNVILENSVKPIEDTLASYEEAGLERATIPVLRALEMLGYFISNKNERKPVAKREVTYRSVTTLKDLLDSHILFPCQIVSTVNKYPATAEITPEGNIIFNEKIYTSLSLAGGAAIRSFNKDGNNPNGWVFWQTEDENGVMRSLSEYRTMFETKIED